MTRPPARDEARRRLPAAIALMWAMALDRFRDYVQGRRGTDPRDQEHTGENDDQL
jgi:hypothetical protein